LLTISDEFGHLGAYELAYGEQIRGLVLQQTRLRPSFEDNRLQRRVGDGKNGHYLRWLSACEHTNGRASLTAYQESARLANKHYRSRLSSYFEVIDAKLQLFPPQLALAQFDLERKLAISALY
jgi:hypothetical protein